MKEGPKTFRRADACNQILDYATDQTANAFHFRVGDTLVDRDPYASFELWVEQITVDVEMIKVGPNLRGQQLFFYSDEYFFLGHQWRNIRNNIPFQILKKLIIFEHVKGDVVILLPPFHGAGFHFSSRKIERRVEIFFAESIPPYAISCPV